MGTFAILVIIRRYQDFVEFGKVIFIFLELLIIILD
jgi:hypothetical protein